MSDMYIQNFVSDLSIKHEELKEVIENATKLNISQPI